MTLTDEDLTWLEDQKREHSFPEWWSERVQIDEHNDRIDRLLSAARQAHTQGPGEGWEPIETAPRDGKRIWVCDARGEQYVAWWHQGLRDEFWMDYGDSEPEPMFWRPLPAPPVSQIKPDPCPVDHAKYVGKCPACHARLPGLPVSQTKEG